MYRTKVFALPIQSKDIIIEYAKRAGSKREKRTELLFDGEKALAKETGIANLYLGFKYENWEEGICSYYISCGYFDDKKEHPRSRIEKLAQILGLDASTYGVYEVEC